MTIVRFTVELADPGQAEAVAALLEQRLGKLEGVDRVQAEPVERRDLATTLAIVAGAVAVVRSGGDLVGSLRLMVQELQGLVEDVRGLKRIILNVGDDRVDVTEVGDEEVAELARPAEES